MPSNNNGAQAPVMTRPSMPGGAGGALPHGAEAGCYPLDRLARELSLSEATMLLVSSVIGVGIFLTPGSRRRGDAAFGSLPRRVGGTLLSLAGALANAELRAMYPHAGGDYVYLREAYHPFAGFLVGWLSFFVRPTGGNGCGHRGGERPRAAVTSPLD